MCPQKSPVKETAQLACYSTICPYIYIFLASNLTLSWINSANYFVLFSVDKREFEFLVIIIILIFPSSFYD